MTRSPTSHRAGRRTVLSVILVVGVSVVVSGPAQGATTLGQTDPAAPAGYACGSPTAYLQRAVAAGSRATPCRREAG